jgi:hypothetical protein
MRQQLSTALAIGTGFLVLVVAAIFALLQNR